MKYFLVFVVFMVSIGLLYSQNNNIIYMNSMDNISADIKGKDVEIVDGIKDKALFFNRGNAYIFNENLLNENMPNGAISFWVKFEKDNVDEVILFKNNDDTNNSEDYIKIQRLRDGKLEYRSMMGGSAAFLMSSSAIPKGEWCKVDVLWGANGRYLYVDNIKEAEDTYAVVFGAGKINNFEFGKGVCATFDDVVVKDVANIDVDNKNKSELSFVKAVYKNELFQGDKLSVDLYFKTTKKQIGKAKFQVVLDKNDYTKIRQTLSVDMSKLEANEIIKVTCEFDLWDAPVGDNKIELMPLNINFINLKTDKIGLVNIKKKGYE